MNARFVFVLIPALAAPLLTAQETKPAPPKVPSHAPTQSKLNKIRLDERKKNQLKEAGKKLESALKRNEAAKREGERMQKEKAPATTDEVKSKLEKLKASVDKNDLKELETLLKDSAPAVKEEIKKYRDQKRAESTAPSVNPAPDAAPVPGSFETVSTLEPIPLQKAPVLPPAPIKADRAIKGPSRDPKNPDKMLPDSDPRTRTWILTGNVTLRQPTRALDADEIDIVFKQGGNPESSGNKQPGSPPGVDPINRPKNGGSAIERIVARGRVRLMIVDKNGKVQAGRGGHMIYEDKTGWFVIKDWPEAELGGKLVRGPSKDSVIRLGDLQSTQPEVEVTGFTAYTLEKPLTPDDLPKTADKPVPKAGAVLPKPSDAPSPAPR